MFVGITQACNWIHFNYGNSSFLDYEGLDTERSCGVEQGDPVDRLSLALAFSLFTACVNENKLEAIFAVLW